MMIRARLLSAALSLVILAAATAEQEPDKKASQHGLFDEDSTLLQVRRFSPGIMMMFVAYVALISATVGRYRHAAKQQAAACGDNSNNNSASFVVKCCFTYAQAKRVIAKAVLQTIGVFLLLIIVCAVIITLLLNRRDGTSLDQRMVYIINGLSRLTAAAVTGLLSVRVALWLELYQSFSWTTLFRKNKPVPSSSINSTATATTQQQKQRQFSTLMELQFAVQWSIAKKILRSFFWLLVLFQEGADSPVTIPASIVAGIATGMAVDLVIYKCRRLSSAQSRKYATLALVTALSLLSVFALSAGVLFVASVWDDKTENVENSNWPTVALVGGLVVMPAVHLIIWKLGNVAASRQIKHGIGGNDNGNNNDNNMSNSIPSNSQDGKQRMVMSLLFSSEELVKTDNDDDNNNDTERIDKITEEESPTQEIDEEFIQKLKRGDLSDCSIEDNAKIDDRLPASVRNKIDGQDDITSPPTWKELMMDWKCCGCVRGKDKTVLQKIHGCTVWTIYNFVCFFCLFLVIVNIRATEQQHAAKVKLPYVHEKLYKYMDEGPVCAFDNRGADSNITTFPDKDAAHRAGFLVLHCGACAACSDWHNLELEYTTRNFLALESRKCAQKTLFGGGRDVVVECLESDDIGFSGQCAVCWAEDILCTKKFCASIGIQSFLINTIANFEVGPNTITAAACEEAHCEAGNPGHFVACSGANRRRMNVTSTISRPGSQRCSIVDVDWAELFPNPHPND